MILRLRTPANNDRGPLYAEYAFAALHQANARHLPLRLIFGVHAGSVIEWNEALISGFYRGWRGGGFNNPASVLQSSNRIFNYPTHEDIIGFRVATVPEPSTLVLAALGFIGLAAWGWRRARCS